MISTVNIKDGETRRVLNRMALVINMGLSTKQIPSTLSIKDPEVKRTLDVFKQDMRTGQRRLSGATNIKDPEVRRVIESMIKELK